MIILLQSVATQFYMLFWHVSYCNVQQNNFITKCDSSLSQSASGITKCDRLLLQSASGIIKCDRLYCKVRQVLQSMTVITKWDVTVWANNSGWLNCYLSFMSKEGTTCPKLSIFLQFLPISKNLRNEICSKLIFVDSRLQF